MKQDNKTIGITLRFFTNNLPDKVGSGNKQTPFWTVGTAALEGNATKGIKAQSVIFHSIEDIPAVLRKIMMKAKLSPITELKNNN